ncbi:MAG: tetratricopeptide repeat protein, partial [Dehalococcoidia bacterium]|nr:tetratricopeptide repeat protein [Dehalococcoidia bacterium]
MTTARNQLAPSGANVNLSLWVNRGLEALWLLTVFLVPLAFLDRDYARSEALIAYAEVPKIALLRTLTGLMAVLWLVEWVAQGRVPFSSLISGGWSGVRPSLWPAALSKWLRESPTRWLLLAVGVYLGTTLLSTVLSSSVNTSIWGEIPGQDGYSAYNVIAYVLLFSVIATHLKTRAQLWRLLGTIVAMGVFLAGYGMLQHYGFDFFDLSEISGSGSRRVTGTTGNPIFTAAVLSMTIPATLAVAAVAMPEPVAMFGRRVESQWQWARSLAPMGLWAGVLTVQLLGIMFTFSRGPWVGTIVGLACFLGLSLLVAGWRHFWRASLVLGLAGAWSLAFLQWQGNINFLNSGPLFSPLMALGGVLVAGAVWTSMRVLGLAALALGTVGVAVAALILVPIWFGGSGPGSSQPVTEERAGELAQRFSSIRTDVLGGFIGGRGTHWTVSWSLIRGHPWFEFDDLSLRRLRPLIGYGPDLFRYTYLLESPPEDVGLLNLEPDHAHNYFIHQAVEQGFLGLLSSLGLFAAVFLAGGYMVWRHRQRNYQTRFLLLIGLVAILAGRFLEMQVGIARVSDLTILWTLLAMFAALSTVVSASEAVPEPAQPLDRPQRRQRGRREVAAVALTPKWAYLWWLAIVAALIGMIAVVTWVKGINNVRAAVSAGDAVRSFQQGDLEAAMASLDRAIELAPNVPVYYNYKASVYLTYQVTQRSTPEPECSKQVDIGYSECLAFQRYLSDLAGVDRRPFYYRSRLAVAASAYDLRDTDYSIRTGENVRTIRLRDETVRYYQESLALVPANWHLQNELADALLEAGRPTEALENLEGSLAITKDTALSARAPYLQATAYRDLGQLEESARALERSLAISFTAPWAPEAIERLQETYVELGRPVTVEYFDGIIDRNPEDAIAIYNRGLAYRRLGQPERAVADFGRSIALGFRSAEVYAARGNAFFATGTNDGQARVDLAVAINFEPQNPLYHVYLGNFYRSRAPEAAIMEFDQAIQLDPQLALTYIYRGQHYLDVGEFQRAIQDFDRAIRLDPQSALAYNGRGYYYLAQDQPQRAVADFGDAIRLNPQLAEAYTGRGQAYNDLGLHRQATTDLQHSIAITENRPESPADRLEYAKALYLQGEAHLDLGRLEESRRFLEQSLSIDFASPWVSNALVDLQEAYAGLGRPDTVGYFDGIIDRNPEDAIAIYNRGLTYSRLGQPERAVADFGRSIALGFRSAEVYAARGNAFFATGTN